MRRFLFFGQRFGGANDFERTLGLYGTCTGTVPSGIALIRIVDPDFRTATGVELGGCVLAYLAALKLLGVWGKKTFSWK